MVEGNVGRLGGPGHDPERFRALLAETQAALTSMRSAQKSGTEAVTGHGEALSGLISVTAAPDGTISALDLGPRAMRMPSADLAEGIRTAVNAALADLGGRGPGAATDAPPVDLAALQTQVADLQQQGLARMEAYSQTIDQVVKGLRRDRR